MTAFRSSCIICIVLMLIGTPVVYAQKNNIAVTAVKTDKGLISGSTGLNREVLVFRGIPFAAPPVGELRWKEPQPAVPWAGVRKCESFGPNAMQGEPVPFFVWTGEFLIPKNGIVSEDCLYLNVWTGAKAVTERRPVIVYIHGGGFVNGSGSVPIYDGEAMAAKGIVFVTINYRMGVFGFLAHPELTRESPHHASGNYGILDQIAALQWVQRNIQAFGGDAGNVTIAGQSAGAMSVNTLCASPLAKGLFHKVIAESGANVVRGRLGGATRLADAENAAVKFLGSVGSPNVATLRKQPADEVMALYKERCGVVIDGYVLPGSMQDIFAVNKQTIVPLLTGYNADDLVFIPPATLDGFREYVRGQFIGDTADIFRLYPAATDNDAAIAARDLARDAGFGLQNFAWASMQSRSGRANVYLYFFNRKVPEFGGTNVYGAFHSGEICYAYDNLKFLNRPLIDTDHALAAVMSSYWASFARTGDPNSGALPVWPVFSQQKGEVMIFDTQAHAGRHPDLDQLNFLYQQALRR